MVKKYLLFLILVTITYCCFADKNKEKAFCILSKADVLYMINREQVIAFIIILENENAEQVFVDLLKKSRTGVGKFYALLGLFNLNKNRYNEIKETIDLSEKVKRQIFDIDPTSLNTETLSQLIVPLENGSWIRNVKSVFITQDCEIWQNIK